MADLNALIAQGAQFRQAPDPFVQYGQMQQLEQNQQTNALNQMKMQEMQRGMETTNALNRAYQSNMNVDTGEINYPGVYKSLGSAGAGSSIPGIQKTQFEAEKERALLAKTKQETFGLQNKAIGAALTMAMSNPTDAGLNQAFSILENQKIDTTGLRSQFANITDPTERLKAIQSYATAHPEGIAAMKFVAPDPMEVTRADGSKIFLDKNPHSPTYGKGILPPQAAGMTQTQAATVETGKGQLKVSQDRLAFDREKDAYERANPGFTIEKVPQTDGTERFKKVNKQTGVATDVMDASGTALTGAAKITLSPLATLQRDLTNAPPNSKQADQLRAKILKEITDTSQAQLKLAQDRFAWDKANPGYHIDAINNPDGSQRFVAVNKQTLKAYPITEAAIGSGTPPNVGAPLVGLASGVAPAAAPAQTVGGPAAAPAQTVGGPAAAPAQPPSAPATQGQSVPLTSARPYKEPTTPEQNAGYNIGRILRAATSIQDVIAKDPTALAPKVGEALASSFGLGGVANAARTGNRQIVYGAQRDVVDALLYLATGAAYNTGQILAQRDTYMPQFTDKPETVIEKQRRLVELLGDAKTRAGKAWTPKMDAAMNALNIQSAAPGGVDANNPLLRGK
jgi:hypothetical protein